MAVREIASGLRFPEGPIALPDGSVRSPCISYPDPATRSM